MDAAVLDLFRRGKFARADALHRSSKPSSSEAVVLAAELSERVGRRSDASRMATRLLGDSTLSPQLRSRCLTLLGQLALEDGRVKEAVRFLGEAVSVARDNESLEQRCWAELKLIVSLVELSDGDATVALLADLRRHVTQTGDPFLVVALHTLVSELEARRGAVAAAQRHARVARNLLDRHPNDWLSGLNELADLCASYLSFDMDSALATALRTLDVAAESGHERTRLAAYINLGHIHVAKNDLQQAERFLTSAWRISHISPRCREPLIGAFAELELAKGDLAKCQEYLARLWNVDSPGHSHSKLWAYRTQVEVLARSAGWVQALAAADAAIAEAERAKSTRVGLLLRLQRAEVRAMSGDVDGAMHDIAAVLQVDSSSVEIVADAHCVLARAFLRAGDRVAAQVSLDRGERIFGALGLVRARRWGETRSDTDGNGRVFGEEAARPDLVLMGLAVLLQQGFRADLFGAEAMDLVLASGIARRAALVVKYEKALKVSQSVGWSAAEAAAAARSSSYLLQIGQWREAEWLLIADVRPTVAARAAWLALQTIVNAGVELAAARSEAREREALWPIESADEASHGVFRSEQMLELLRITRRIAATDVTVLLTGETGAGKEVLARVLHDASPRAAKPFVPLNCSAVPRDMLEAQLFGHRRGAFTGADSAFPGVLRAAAGGTVFLDEIGEISLDLQPKLLRFLESGEVHPLGETQPVKVNVRVLAATNQDLDRLVREGRFREDLYYRLNVIHLRVPPLRERREEIPLLVQHFLERFAREFNKGRLRLADETMEYFVLHAWPGNVRQLANELRRLAALAEQDAVLMPEHLSPALAATRRTRPASERDLMPTELVVRLDQPLAAATEHLERAMIQHALALCHGRVDQVARTLGLSRKGLYLKRRRLKLDAPAGV